MPKDFKDGESKDFEAKKLRNVKDKYGEDPGHFSRRPKQTLSEEVITLDEDIIRLLLRRAALMQKLRRGKTHAATPAVIKSEKQIRNAWEARASRITRNPRLIRQLFGLIQDLDIQEKPVDTAYAPFNMAPARSPVEVNLPGPASDVYARLWVALSAAAGKSVRLPGLSRSAALNDCLGAFAQCGVRSVWKPDPNAQDAQNIQNIRNGRDILELSGGNQPEYHEKSIFVGDDEMTFYLLAFLGVAHAGKMRFTGGVRLKDADLGAVARFMPALGARLAWVVPGSRGLPAALECSALLPAQLEIPEDLPEKAVLALMLSAITWQTKINIKLPVLPQAGAANISSMLRPIFQALPDQAQLLGDTAEYAGFGLRELEFPAEVAPLLDPLLCAPILSLPLFAGGSVRLAGKLADKAQLAELVDILKAMSLEIKADDLMISSTAQNSAVFPASFERRFLSDGLHPLFWLFNARIAHKTKAPVRVGLVPAGADLDLAREFLAQAGFSMDNDGEGFVISFVDTEDFREAPSKSYGWSSPGSGWTLALSLAAFMRANLKISNPDSVSVVLPEYWHLYNGLPKPSFNKAINIAEEEKPRRRRIMTNTVIEDNADIA